MFSPKYRPGGCRGWRESPIAVSSCRLPRFSVATPPSAGRRRAPAPTCWTRSRLNRILLGAAGYFNPMAERCRRRRRTRFIDRLSGARRQYPPRSARSPWKPIPDGHQKPVSHRRRSRRPISPRRSVSAILSPTRSSTIIGAASLPDVRERVEGRCIGASCTRMARASTSIPRSGLQEERAPRRPATSIGKFHPHGDVAVYGGAGGALAQDFCPALTRWWDGQGNFGKHRRR